MSASKPLTLPDESALVEKSAQGDLQAFNQLVIGYQDLAYSHASAILDDPMMADDATQESFIKAFQKIGSLRNGAFRPWLLKIVTNTSIDLLRAQKRLRSQSLSLYDEYGDEIESPAWLVDPDASVEARVEQNDTSRRVHQALKELPAPYRSVVTLVDLYEMDYLEAAEILKIPLGTVKSRLARGRLMVRAKLEEARQIPAQFQRGAPVTSPYGLSNSSAQIMKGQ